MLTSARTGEGIDEWREWLAAVPDRVAGDGLMSRRR